MGAEDWALSPDSDDDYGSLPEHVGSKLVFDDLFFAKFVFVAADEWEDSSGRAG